MNVQSTLTYWRKSFEFFKTDSLKIFIFATLNTFVRSGKIIFRNFWWLFLLDAVFAFWPSPFTIFPSMITSLIIFYVMILTARPSLEEKSWNYYIHYQKANLISLFFSFLQGLIVAPLAILLHNNQMVLGTLALIIPCLVHISLFLPTMFFYLDSNLSFQAFCKSLKQALRLAKNFLPIMLIITVFWTIQYAPVNYMQSTFSIPYPLTLIIHVFGKIHALLIIVNVSVLYTRFKHEHFKLLFE